jgi:hypothetical protein
MADNDKPILMGNRSVSVLNAQGEPVSGEEAARIALPGMQQTNGLGGQEASEPGLLRRGASWYNEHMGNLAGTAAYGADKVINPVARAMGFEPTPFGSIEEAQAKAKGLTPTTPAGVAAQLVGGPLVSRLGPLKGVAAGTAGGAALEGASGGDPMAGAVTGFTGTAIPAAVGGATNLLATVGQKIATKAGIRAQVTEPQAARMLQGMKEDVPALYAKLKGLPGSSPAKLSQIHDSDVWDESMGALMKKAEDPIIKAVPTITAPAQVAAPKYVETPEMAAVRKGLGLRKGEPPPGGWDKYIPGHSESMPDANTQTMPMADALSQLKNMKADASKAYDPAHPALGREMREAARDWEEKIVRAVNAKDSTLAKNWADAMDQYNKAVRYRELGKAALTDANPEAAGSPFDTSGLLRHFWANAGDYHPSVLPGFNRHFFTGEPGAQPTITDPGLYARMFGPAGVKANIPVPKGVTIPGQQYGAPNVADLLSTAARSGVINLSETASGRR